MNGRGVDVILGPGGSLELDAAVLEGLFPANGFLAEKGITLPLQPIDLGALQQMSADYGQINPLKRVPALVLDNGTVITESIAICRYFEELQPDPPSNRSIPLRRCRCGESRFRR